MLYIFRRIEIEFVKSSDWVRMIEHSMENVCSQPDIKIAEQQKKKMGKIAISMVYEYTHTYTITAEWSR